MPLITRPIPENPVARQVMGRQLPATLGEALGATISDPLLRPTQLGVREFQSEDRTPGMGEFVAREMGERVGEFFGFEDEPQADRPLVDPEKLNEEFKDLGISFDRPVSREYAETRARQKREEIIRQDVIARGPGGVLPTTARFGAMLAGAAIDPLNIAASFIPVVGQARYAGLVGRFGKTQARAIRGMTEGAVGNAAIEPFVYGLAKQQQMDYTLADSAINIALGGFLGGGLHLGAGKISDFVASRSPEVRETALRSSVSQMAQGRRPNIEPVFRIDEQTRMAAMRIAMGQDEPSFRTADFSETAIPASRDIVARLKSELTPIAREKIPRGEVEQLQSQRRDLQSRIKELESKSLAAEKRAVREEQPELRGREVERAARERRQAEIEEVRSQVDSIESRLQSQDRSAKAESELSRIDTRIRRGDDPETVIVEEAQRIKEDFPELEVDQIVAERNNVSQQGFTTPLTIDQARRQAGRVAREEMQPERDITADFKASRRVARDNESEVSAQEEADFLEEEVVTLRNEGLITEAQEVEIRQLNELASRADRYQEAAKVAARCVSR